MYSVWTRQLCDRLHLPFLLWLPHAFAWIALVAWSLAFLGLVETGTHEELLATQGFYYDLYQSQFAQGPEVATAA
jgi:hypothetical protein